MWSTTNGVRGGGTGAGSLHAATGGDIMAIDPNGPLPPNCEKKVYRNTVTGKTMTVLVPKDDETDGFEELANVEPLRPTMSYSTHDCPKDMMPTEWVDPDGPGCQNMGRFKVPVDDPHNCTPAQRDGMAKVMASVALKHNPAFKGVATFYNDKNDDFFQAVFPPDPAAAAVAASKAEQNRKKRERKKRAEAERRQREWEAQQEQELWNMQAFATFTISGPPPPSGAVKRWKSAINRQIKLQRHERMETAKNRVAGRIREIERERADKEAKAREEKKAKDIAARERELAMRAMGPKPKELAMPAELPGPSEMSKRKGKKAISREKGQEHEDEKRAKEELRVLQQEELREARRKGKKIGGW